MFLKFDIRYIHKHIINNIRNIVTSKFKEKLWCEKYLEAKRKLRYYKEQG